MTSRSPRLTLNDDVQMSALGVGVFSEPPGANVCRGRNRRLVSATTPVGLRSLPSGPCGDEQSEPHEIS
jgi:hypothetical protein